MMKLAVLPLRPVLGLTLVLALSSCGFLDMFRPSPVGDPGGSLVNRAAAENACVAAVRQQGLAFRHVVSIQPLAGEAGVVVGRDLILAVRSGADDFEIGCRFINASGTAQLVTG